MGECHCDRISPFLTREGYQGDLHNPQNLIIYGMNELLLIVGIHLVGIHQKQGGIDRHFQQ